MGGSLTRYHDLLCEAIHRERKLRMEFAAVSLRQMCATFPGNMEIV